MIKQLNFKNVENSNELYTLLLAFNFTKSSGTSSIGIEFDFINNNSKGYVYCLCYENNVVYIGASANRNRIGSHKKNKKFTEVYYLICSNNYHWSLESDLIKKLKTKYNIRRW
tara:strand:- start:223 stop:561 length:339 start_codon:yes stop_codon:yes gene_type:complete